MMFASKSPPKWLAGFGFAVLIAAGIYGLARFFLIAGTILAEDFWWLVMPL
jgi:hypothetical protein